MIFLYVGNCLVLTGKRNGHASSWHSRSSSIVLQGANSLISFFCAFSFSFSFLAAKAEGEVSVLGATMTATLAFDTTETSLPWLQFVVDTSSLVVTELCEGVGL